MNILTLFYILIMMGVPSIAQKWQIQITHCSLLDIKKYHPTVTAIVNAANVYMRGGKKQINRYFLKTTSPIVKNRGRS